MKTHFISRKRSVFILLLVLFSSIAVFAHQWLKQRKYVMAEDGLKVHQPASPFELSNLNQLIFFRLSGV